MKRFEWSFLSISHACHLTKVSDTLRKSVEFITTKKDGRNLPFIIRGCHSDGILTIEIEGG